MRLRACLGMMLLTLTGCHSLPAIIRIEVDGSTLEFKKVPPEPDTPPADANAVTGDAPAP